MTILFKENYLTIEKNENEPFVRMTWVGDLTNDQYKKKRLASCIKGYSRFEFAQMHQ